MAKTKKAPKASRSSKAKRAPAKRLRGLEKALGAIVAPVSPSASSRRGRKWSGGRLTQTDLDAVAAGKGRVELPSGGPVAAPARATRMLADPRLPAVGQVILKTYKGRELRVIRLADRFEFEGRDYPSLSKIAREVIGGAQVNGFAFFGLNPKPEAAAPAKDEPSKS